MGDILKHLAGFEKNQNELGDRYGAEILHNAAKEIECLTAKTEIDKITMDNFLGQIKSLTARNEKLEAVYEAANGVAINKGAARALAVKILIDVIAAVQTTEGVRPGDLLK